jgi:hypothetical protein
MEGATLFGENVALLGDEFAENERVEAEENIKNILNNVRIRRGFVRFWSILNADLVRIESGLSLPFFWMRLNVLKAGPGERGPSRVRRLLS